MNETTMRRRWRPTRTQLVTSGIVIAAFLLTGWNWGFLALVGLGTMGPGILRELGWLRDKDEFQMQAARRAGYHGFLAAGLVAFCLAAYYRVHPDATANPGNPVELVLAVLWFTWLLSSLFAYWGARKTAVRILLIFGFSWLFFVIASSFGEETFSLLGLLMGSLIVLPFFALAWAAPRWPRVAGAILLVCSCFFIYFFGLYKVLGDPFGSGRVFVIIFFVGPLLAAGLGLLGRDVDAESEETSPEEAPA